MYQKTVGIIGTGKIGSVVARILLGFGCEVMAFDPVPNPECQKAGVRYVPLADLLTNSRIITLHCPLNSSTRHLINEEALNQMQNGVMLINTSRGGLVDTPALIQGLKTKRVGYLGLDVYEEEAEIFFEDRSNDFISDDIFARLLTFPNVLVTGHQAFFTEEALSQIAETTIQNLSDFENARSSPNEIHLK